MKELILHPEARAEWEPAIQWYENQRLGLGLEFNDAVEAASIRSKHRRGGDGGTVGKVTVLC